MSYEWFDFDVSNASLHTGKTYTISGLSLGNHHFTLIVTDNNGATAQDTVTVTITDPPPTVTSTNPAHNATNVAVDSNITITFSEYISNANTSSITLEDNASPPNQINGTVTPSNGTTITFDPDSNLSYNTTYTLTISTGGIKDSANNTLDSNVTKSFTTHPRFERNATNETVYDHATGRMWQDDSNAKTTQKNWLDAIDYCNNLTFAGHSDWKLPSLDELLSIVDTSRPNGSKINSAFTNFAGSWYWSSTPALSSTLHAIVVGFHTGETYWGLKTDIHYVRCIRDVN